MRYFPAFTDLDGRACLVVGGGETAARKVRLLRRARASVVVVAPSLTPELAELAAAGHVTHHRRAFRGGDVLGKALVIAGTERADVDERVAEIARAANVPVNAVDWPEASTFITPAIVDRDPVVIGISSGGAGPVLARQIRERLEAMLPANLGRLATFAEGFRSAVAATLGPGRGRLRFWQRVFDGPVAEDVLAGRETAASARLHAMLRDAADEVPRGEVAIVGAGPGDPDLLTFKALRHLQRADVVVHDRLVAAEIVAYARRDAERVFVGKARGSHACSQENINTILLSYARQGLKVVRLKGGDPMIFGRGGEERDYLVRHGVATVVVPGVTAATGCAAAAGLALTDRRHASAVTFVTGHPHDAEAPPDWAALARRGQTLAIYMGVGTAAATAEQLMAHGLAPETPAGVIERGTLPDQRVLATTLAGLGETVRQHDVHPPALLVVGEVARVLDRGAAGVARERVPDAALAAQ